MTSCRFAIGLLCIQTLLALHASWSSKMLSHPRAPQRRQPRVPSSCVASLPTVAWVLWHFSAGSWKWRLIRSDRKSFWQLFAVLVVWCFCLRQLKWTLQRDRAQVYEQGLSLDNNPAHLRHEKALHKSISKRFWEIQASLHPRWYLDDINHCFENSWSINYMVGFFTWWDGREHNRTFFFSPRSC